MYRWKSKEGVRSNDHLAFLPVGPIDVGAIPESIGGFQDPGDNENEAAISAAFSGLPSDQQAGLRNVRQNSGIRAIVESGEDWRANLADDQELLSLFKEGEDVVKSKSGYTLTRAQAEGVDEQRGKGRFYRPSSNFPQSSTTSPSPAPSPVFIPGRDALNFATSGVVDALTSFIFEDLAGTEIITLMKRDTIDGIDPNYSIISNISDARKTFDPTSLLSKKTRTDSYFDIFGIQLLDKIPDDEYLAKQNITNYYYIDSNGDLIIELDNMDVNERIDIEIATNGTISEVSKKV